MLNKKTKFKIMTQLLLSVSIFGLSSNYNFTFEEPIKVNALSELNSSINITNFSSGVSNFMYIKSDGTVWGVGNNANGQLGVGNTTAKLPITKIPISDVKKVVTYNNSSFFIKNDGTVWAVGVNDGRLGDGTTTQRTSPVQIQIDNIKDVFCGTDYTVFLKNDGTVWGCGDGTALGLGYGVTSPISPVKLYIENVKDVSCGSDATFFMKNDGTVWGCGRNTSGQLGLGGTTIQYAPIQLSVDNVKKVVTSGYSSYLIKNDGTVFGTGENNYGQLGLGNTTKQTTFVQVPIDNVKDIASDCSYGMITLFLKNDGTVWGSGYNNYGGLGIGNTIQQNSPTKIPINDIKEIYCSGWDSVFVKSDNTILGAGRNLRDEFGITGTQLNPININLLSQSDIVVNAVTKAETTKLQADKDSAQTLVTALPTGTDKTNLQARLDVVQAYINANTAVTKAESTKSQIDKDTAQSLVTALVDGVDKTSLQNRLNAIVMADVIAPVLTLTPSITNTTNQDITITAIATDNISVNSITTPDNNIINSSSTTYKIDSNGTYTFKATDSSGNSVTKSITINNIDKTAPILILNKDIIDETNSSITITANATDNIAVVSITEPDDTIVTGNSISYKVNTNGTYTFKAIDTSGNITTQSIIINNIDTVAYKAVSQAENTKTQTDVDNAKLLVNALPNGDYKSSLIQRLDVVQSYIDNANQGSQEAQKLKEAQEAVTQAGNTLAPTDVIKAQTVINELPDSPDKTNLQQQLNLTIATQAVVKAEGSKAQADVNNARTLVNSLPDSTAKTSLNQRLDTIQAEIDKATQDSQNALNLKNAQDSVTKAETTKTQANVNDAREKVKILPDGADKTSLTQKLDVVQSEINKAIQDTQDAQKLKDAQSAVTQAGITLSSTDVSKAQTAINNLSDSTDKTNLQNTLDKIKQAIADKQAQDAYNNQLADATKLVTTAEGTKDTYDIAKAQSAVSSLPSGSDKDSLQARLDALKTQVAKDEQLKADTKEATLKVQIAEASVNLSSIKTYISNAQTAIDKLPSCTEKTALQTRLDALKAIIANNANKSLAQQAKPLVQLAELYKTSKYINNALAVVNQMTDCQAKTDYINRLNAIK